MRLKLLLPLGLVLAISGCVVQLPWAPDDVVQRAVYTHSGPASVTLLSVVANGTSSAGHTALMINGSQRVIYDPAGTWYNKDVPERADLLYGITPKMLDYYVDYHARDRFHVVMQTKTVPREVADDLIARTIKHGASMNAMCAQNSSMLLSQTPGFAGFPVSVWPKSAVAGMAAVPGVQIKKIYQTDEGKDLKE